MMLRKDDTARDTATPPTLQPLVRRESASAYLDTRTDC
jgi:hypothetical protein